MLDFEILIKSFMRPSSLENLVVSIRKYYPDVKISVVDDSPTPVECADCNMFRLPVDSGISAGRNFLLEKVTAPFFVICDDDFVFTDATRLEELQRVMEEDSDIAIAGGQVTDAPGPRGVKFSPGPARLKLDGKIIIKEFMPQSNDMIECDSISNFWMGRTEFFREHNVKWDEKLKVQEHAKFFLDFPGKVVALNWVRVMHAEPENSPEYQQYRSRQMLKEVHGLEVREATDIHVLITVPNEHWLHKMVTQRLMLLQMDRRYKLRFEWPSHKPYENNLHHIVSEFYQSNCSYWLNIDSDNPPMQNPLDLVAFDKDIIGLPTPVWHYTGKPGERPIYWNAYDYDREADAYREHSIKEGFQRVDAIGTGCFLIARRVFDHPEMRKAPFHRKQYADGTVHKGNDISFCERARERGFEIWAHYGYPCRHFCDNIELTEVEQSIKGLWELEQKQTANIA